MYSPKKLRRFLTPWIAVVAMSLLLLSPATAKTTIAHAPLFNNLGNYHFVTDTDVPLAQHYFDQGLILFYGFDYAESIRSFQAATVLDPHCALCYWGLALALGSKNNTPMQGNEQQLAYAAIKKAQQLVSLKKDPRAQAYIHALAKRYVPHNSSHKPKKTYRCHGDTTISAQQAQAYAQAAQQLMQQFPNDVDAKNLYAAAMFDVNDWAFFKANGKPLAHTLNLIDTLAAGLQLDPKNPGTHHYYIHVIEQSPHPARALASANYLRDAVPGAEHLVHMPAHIYQLVGRYHDASIANEKAIAAFQQYQRDCLAQGFKPKINYLYQHNLHFLWASAAIEGRHATAVQAARQLAAITPENLAIEDNLQLFWSVIYLAHAQFGDWQQILKMPRPHIKNFQFQLGIWHYARGLALIHRNKVAAAQQELAALEKIAQQKPSDKILNSSGKDQLDIAVPVLAAVIAMHQGDDAAALPLWRKAVKLQDNVGYKEPPRWYFPNRLGLAATLLKMGHAKKAAAVYRHALKKYPGNGWILFGLMQALQAQGKHEQAATVAKEFKEAWQYADIKEPLPF